MFDENKDIQQNEGSPVPPTEATESAPAAPEAPEITFIPPEPPVSAPPAYEAAPRFVPDGPLKKTSPKKAATRSGKTPWFRIIILTLVLSLIGGAAGNILTGYLTEQFADEPATPSFTDDDADKKPEIGGNTTVLEGERNDVTIETDKVDTSGQKALQEVYRNNVASTVGITTSITTNYWGYQSTSAASGSGVVYTADGYILTNFHVIENSSSITVSFYDGTSKNARLVGYDATNDIAVLKVDAQGLKPVVLGDSDKLMVGDTVAAIGNPLGELTFTLTSGVVSALAREVAFEEGITMSLIQTDCAINSGNSGGALFNMYGELVGITNAKYSTSGINQATIDNIGFAIPITDIRSIINGIIEKGEYEKPFIGVTVSDVSARDQEAGKPVGAYIISVEADLAAHKAGIKANDIITKFGSLEIKTSNDLRRAIKRCKAGQKIKLTVYRGNTYVELELIMDVQVYPALPQQP